MTADLDLETRREKFNARLASLHAEHRHGLDDVLGSLNYLDAAARTRGRDAILDGRSLSLSRQVRSGRNARNDGGQAFEHEFFETDWGSEEFLMRTDRMTLDCHGDVNTHIDALNHLGWNGQWYNGRALSNATDSGSVLDLARFGIFTRGVYVNVAAVRGEAYISPDRPIDGADIDAALRRSGACFETGDALLLDCGRDVFETEVGDWGEEPVKPGSGAGVAEWLIEHNPSLLLWDMMDAISDREISGAVHQVHWAIGLILVDNCSFEVARPVLAERRQATGGLAIAPLLVAGATGNNVNPMLIL